MGTVRYTVANGEIIGEKRSGLRSLYVPDPLGPTIALFAATQTKTDTWTYWPYGEVKTRTGTTATAFNLLLKSGHMNGNQMVVFARKLARSLGRSIGLIPLLALACGADASTQTDERSLLGRSTKVADATSWGLTVPDWRNGAPVGIINTYDWISDHELLVFLHTPPARVSWPNGRPMVSQAKMEGDPYLFNSRSKTYCRLASLGDVFRKTHGLTNSHAKLSPNGVELLWMSSDYLQDASVSEFHKARLDGTARSQWSGGSPFWSWDSEIFDHLYSPNGNKWLGLRKRKTKNIYRNPQLERTHWVKGNRSYSILLPQVRSTFLSDAQPTRAVTIIESALNAKSSVHRYTAILPRTATVLDAVLSPDGRRVLWILFTKHATGENKALSNGVPSASVNETSTSFWLSDRHGTNIRKVGEMSSAGLYPAVEPQLVRWVPGGKSVSFYYSGALWTSPVP